MKSGKKRNRPEAKIQKDIINYLTVRGWFVMQTHGNMYQSGFPDLYATHYKYGARWIEVKLPEMKGSRFTVAQMEKFPKLRANGTRIWVLMGANDMEYSKLFKPDNIQFYLLNQL